MHKLRASIFCCYVFLSLSQHSLLALHRTNFIIIIRCKMSVPKTLFIIHTSTRLNFSSLEQIISSKQSTRRNAQKHMRVGRTLCYIMLHVLIYMLQQQQVLYIVCVVISCLQKRMRPWISIWKLVEPFYLDSTVVLHSK